MITKKCDECGASIEVDDTKYKPGAIITKACPLCGNSMEVVIPEKSGETSNDEIGIVKAHEQQEVYQAVPIVNNNLQNQNNLTKEDASELLKLQIELEKQKTMTAAAQAHANQVISQQNTAQTLYVESQNGKSKTIAGILGILVGGFGIHKFYLGKTGLGILYILFCWTYIPAIIGFIEGIIYLTMDDYKFAQKYPA